MACVWMAQMGIFVLPEGYKELTRVNLQKDKKLALLINIAAGVTALLLIFVGLVVQAVSFEINTDELPTVLSGLLVLIVAVIGYIIAHELIHGVFIKKFSRKKAKYGLTALGAYAGSDAYFNKGLYLIIALAPVVIFGVIFLLLNIFLPAQWFWPIYCLQILNLSGAVGDWYITYRASKVPADALVRDEGVEIVFLRM